MCPRLLQHSRRPALDLPVEPEETFIYRTLLDIQLLVHSTHFTVRYIARFPHFTHLTHKFFSQFFSLGIQSLRSQPAQ